MLALADFEKAAKRHFPPRFLATSPARPKERAGDDAQLASEHGVDSVIVSNHGGRQLDGAVTPLLALEEVLPKAGAMTVMLDGGIRRGTDVLKALALGAKFVFIARPFLFAAAVFGQPGLQHCIRLLSDEIHRDMTMLGISRIDELDPRALRLLRSSLDALRQAAPRSHLEAEPHGAALAARRRICRVNASRHGRVA